MRVVSLFAGIGGFDLGFERAGMTIVAHVEKDAQCRKLLAAKWPYAVALDDVRTAGKHNLPACDVVCGGFPCQDVSIAGKRAGFKTEDGITRSGLFYKMARITNELQPAFLVWENVPGLLSSDDGRDFARVLMELDRIGYSGAWTSVDAQYYGLAQRRRRVFGVFARRDIGAARCAEILSLSEGLRGHPAPSRKAGQVSPTIPASGVGTSRTGNERTEAGFCVEVTGTIDRKACSANRGGQANEDSFLIPAIAGSLKGGSGARGYPDPADAVDSMIPDVCGCLSDGAHNGGGLNGQDAYPGRLSRCLNAGGMGRQDYETETMIPCGGGFDVAQIQWASGGWQVENPTAQALRSGGEHNYQFARISMGVRRLTPTECERLQGFPDGWTDGFADGPRYRMLGNAVAVPCAEWIGKRIKEST